MFCYFAFFHARDPIGGRLSEDDLLAVRRILDRVPGLSRALVHTPTPADTPHAFPKDELPPVLALQLYAEELQVLETALAPAGRLQALTVDGAVPGLTGTQLYQQVMLVRSFPVDDAVLGTPAGGKPCSYLVHYPGAAENLNAWLTHYLEHHPGIMRSFPGIREIEIYTRVDWIGGLPGMRVDLMQRNKQVFDSPQALSAALLSPVIRTMRADYHAFPAFFGGNVHYPMLTEERDTACH
jgi:hypothetical protein